MEAANMKTYGLDKMLTKNGRLRPSTAEVKKAAAQASAVKIKALDEITKAQNASKVVQNHSRHLTLHFKHFDQNGDGVLTYGELATAMVCNLNEQICLVLYDTADHFGATTLICPLGISCFGAVFKFKILN